MPPIKPEHTARFLMKVLWKYKGAESRREIVVRLLEYDCIRRNWTKGTLINIVQAFRAWLKDPESKSAKKLSPIYRDMLEEFKTKEPDMNNIHTELEEETMGENKDEHCVSEEQVDIQKEINKLEQKKEMLQENYSKMSMEIGAQSRILSIKLSAITEAFHEECQKIDDEMNALYKKQALQELMK
jgi:hypothetical protein